MKFQVEGRGYDSAALVVYETGNVDVPFVFRRLDYSEVLVASLDAHAGLRFHRADSAEIRALADRFAIPDLRRAIPPG